MRRGIDFEKMEVAFKRAAYKAVHGTREERSGRLLPGDRGYELRVERRPRGDYTVRRGGAGREPTTAPTQKEAIEKAQELDLKARRMG